MSSYVSRFHSAKSPRLLAIAIILVLAVFFTGARTASADDSGNVDSVDGVCMQNAYSTFGQGGDLNCTANDVSLAAATSLTILDDGCAFPGDTVTFRADFEVNVTAEERYDVGIYFSTDGDPGDDGALTGLCSISTPAYAPDPPWLDLDGTTNNTTPANAFGYCSTDGGATLASPTTPCNDDAVCTATIGPGATCNEFGQGIVGSQPYQDSCGDIQKPEYSPLYPTITLTVVCRDDNADGQLDLPYCTSWRQSGANELCLTPLAAYPGSPSKCNCDPGFDVPIEVPGRIIVDKVTIPSPDLSNASFEFTLAGGPGAVTTPFILTDAAPPFDSGGLATGSTPYSVTEDAMPPDWEAVDANCTSDQQGNTPTPDNIVLHPGETVTCTFSNIDNNPLAVALGDLSATCDSATPVLTWETVFEVDTLGFNVWRSTSPARPEQQVNASLLPAQAPGSGQSYTYTWADSTAQAGTIYYYWLEDIDLNGQATLHGPVSTICAAPTAVTLSAIDAAEASSSSVPWWLLTLALAFGIFGIGLMHKARTA